VVELFVVFGFNHKGHEETQRKNLTTEDTERHGEVQGEALQENWIYIENGSGERDPPCSEFAGA
jgi:hypothetical protein